MSRAAAGPTPDRHTLRQGFGGLLRALWFILALAIWLVGYLLHFLGSALIRVSGLAGGSQSLPQPAPIDARPPSPGPRSTPVPPAPAATAKPGEPSTPGEPGKPGAPNTPDGEPPRQP